MTDTAVILAAGAGKRLNGFNGKKPKGFLVVGGLSLIEMSVLKLIGAGIKKIIIGTGYSSADYENFSKSFPQIICVKNEKFADSGSMHTLYNMKDFINGDFLLLESDLLYEGEGLKALMEDDKKDIILASGQTLSTDEVFIDADEKHNKLIKLSKKREELKSVHSELVGITKISYHLFLKMCACAQEKFKKSLKFHYEHILNDLAGSENIYVKKIEDYVWCEIDNEYHYKRAVEIVYPKLKKRKDYA